MIGGMVCGTPVVSHEHSQFFQLAAIVRREPEQVHPEPVPRGLLDQPARSLADVVDRRLLRRPRHQLLDGILLRRLVRDCRRVLPSRLPGLQRTSWRGRLDPLDSFVPSFSPPVGSLVIGSCRPFLRWLCHRRTNLVRGRRRDRRERRRDQVVLVDDDDVGKDVDGTF